MPSSNYELRFLPLAPRDSRNPELERARALVSANHDRASFELLLRSDDMAAVGIALDQYQYGEGASRWATANPFAEYGGEVAARASAVLREPLFPGSD